MFDRVLALLRERWQIAGVAGLVILGGCWHLLSADNAITIVEDTGMPMATVQNQSSAPASSVMPGSEAKAPEIKKININNASSSELQKIPGVGPSKAQLIIDYRQNQRFNSVDELINIKGIGAKTLEKLRDYVTAE